METTNSSNNKERNEPSPSVGTKGAVQQTIVTNKPVTEKQVKAAVRELNPDKSSMESRG